MIQLAHPAGHAIEIFHHPFDRLIAFALILQELSDVKLSVEKQAVIVTRQHQVQGKADTPQETLALQQLVAFGFRQKSKSDHFIQRRCAEVTACDPQNGMDIAQAARAAFDIRFQIVAGAVIAQMALVLFFNFGTKEVGGRPETITENVFLHTEKQRNISANQA